MGKMVGGGGRGEKITKDSQDTSFLDFSSNDVEQDYVSHQALGSKCLEN
jgi:hypothetical protein